MVKTCTHPIGSLSASLTTAADPAGDSTNNVLVRVLTCSCGVIVRQEMVR